MEICGVNAGLGQAPGPEERVFGFIDVYCGYLSRVTPRHGLKAQNMKAQGNALGFAAPQSQALQEGVREFDATNCGAGN